MAIFTTNRHRYERDKQKALIDIIKRHGMTCLKLNTLNSSGWPDLMVFTQGSVFFIEVKEKKGRLRDNQIIRQKQLHDMGQTSVVLGEIITISHPPKRLRTYATLYANYQYDAPSDTLTIKKGEQWSNVIVLLLTAYRMEYQENE